MGVFERLLFAKLVKKITFTVLLIEDTCQELLTEMSFTEVIFQIILSWDPPLHWKWEAEKLLKIYLQ